MRFSQIFKFAMLPKFSNMKHDKCKHRKLIVGLGNYTMPDTRHNVGMSLVSKMVREHQLPWHRDKECLGDVATETVDGGHLMIFLKPRLYMNVNGQSIKKTAKKYDVSVDNIYLIHDDLDLSLGKYTIKYGGSARGHNGVRSAMNSLQSETMPRLRIGIGRPTRKDAVTDYVLSTFTTEEQFVIEGVMENATKLLLQTIADQKFT